MNNKGNGRMKDYETSHASTTLNVFLSYSHENKETAEEIATMIISEGISVWFDEWDVVLGDSLSDKIEQGLNCTHFVFLISKSTPKSKWQGREFKASFAHYINSGNPVIIPIILDETSPPKLISDLKYHRYEGGTNNDWYSIVGSITGKLPSLTLAKSIVKFYKKIVYNDPPADGKSIGYENVCPNCGSTRFTSGNYFDNNGEPHMAIECVECKWGDLIT